ncbi:MAG: hypothetical protein R3208_06670 [Ketobacteraceae bacterium]|nr:hypothetical protein [Ketobacteraceae bacterium]
MTTNITTNITTTKSPTNARMPAFFTSVKSLVWILVLNLPLINSAWAEEGVSPANPALSQAEAIEKAKQYYDTRGEWAGKFTITKVHQVRFESEGPASRVAHIQYQAAFLGDMSKTVEDQRTFGFTLRDGAWQAEWMGGHKSARF